MKNLKAKMKKKAGFTLIEMLIVVAIIAILIAISIPIVGTALESARDATDQANERAAKAVAVLAYFEKAEAGATSGAAVDVKGTAAKFSAFYDAENGVLTTTAPTTPYGKCTGTGNTYCAAGSHKDNIIQVVVTNGKVELSWVATSATLPD